MNNGKSKGTGGEVGMFGITGGRPSSSVRAGQRSNRGSQRLVEQPSQAQVRNNRSADWPIGLESPKARASILTSLDAQVFWLKIVVIAEAMAIFRIAFEVFA